MDRLATRKDALNRQETYQYDPAGNLTQFTDRKNQQSTFTYDSLNRRIGASYADGSSTSFIYDAVGRLTKATDSIVGAIEFLYDNLDRLSKEISAQGVVEYTYDALGRRSTMTANGATPVSYGYDAASRLIQVAQAGLVVGLSYDAAGRRTGLTYPNGTNTNYTYDNASRLTNIVHNGPSGIIESLSYTYDAAGNRISLTRTNGAASNLPAAVQAAYDAANEHVKFGNPPPASPNLTYDANGNLTSLTDSAGTTTYTWDVRNRLVEISGPSLSANFSYDPYGRRTGKTVNGTHVDYLYDRDDIVAEISGGAVSVSYLRSLDIDEPFIRQAAGSSHYYHTDDLGTVLALTDEVGAVQTTYTYEPYGNTVKVGQSASTFQYTGREDDGTGLYYYRARYYNPKIGRFISEDPLEVREGSNRYPYANENPLTWIDPDGQLTRPVSPGPIRGPDKGAVQGGACGARRTNPRTGKNYPHTGVDLLHPAGGDVVAPISGQISPSSPGSILICTQAGTICCNGKAKPKIVCYRLVHISPTRTSGYANEGDAVGTVDPQPPPIPSHVHVEYYERTCQGDKRSCPPAFP